MSKSPRSHSRNSHQLRPIQMTPGVSDYAEGSVLIEFGNTRVLCTASYEEQAPKWVQNSGQGWVTAEYGMLPRSTHTRMKRDKILDGGRTQEISRLIGRSLRAAVNLKAFADKQITVDCDVLNADGGTRTASITGGFVALALAFQKLLSLGEISQNPLQHYVSAVSLGSLSDEVLVDLDYAEDSSVGADVNFVMNSEHRLIEVQGTAEGAAFEQSQLMKMMELANQACGELFQHQEKIVGSFFKLPSKNASSGSLGLGV
jgi:ribonuclease PH